MSPFQPLGFKKMTEEPIHDLCPSTRFRWGKFAKESQHRLTVMPKHVLQQLGERIIQGLLKPRQVCAHRSFLTQRNNLLVVEPQDGAIAVLMPPARVEAH